MATQNGRHAKTATVFMKPIQERCDPLSFDCNYFLHNCLISTTAIFHLSQHSFIHFPHFLFLFFSPLQDTCSELSDYDCPCEVSDSVEDLLRLSPSLTDSEYFKDLEEGIPASHFTTAQEGASLTPGAQVPASPDGLANLGPVQALLTTRSSPLGDALPSFYIHPAEEPQKTLLITQLRPELPDYVCDSVASFGPALDLTINLNGLLRMMDAPNGMSGSEEVREEHGVDVEGELDMDSFPILVRSMSTSRRHSWGVPLSPINLGRR